MCGHVTAVAYVGSYFFAVAGGGGAEGIGFRDELL